MKFILKDSNIFDENLKDKFNDLIEENIDSLNKSTQYDLDVTFNVEMLDDFIPIESPNNKKKKNDPINEYLGTVIDSFKIILEEKDIAIINTRIMGNILDKSMIVIEFKKHTGTNTPINTRAKQQILKTTVIAPNMPYTEETLSKGIAEIIDGIFSNYMSIIKSPKFMSRILDIEETDDYTKLLLAFYEQYGDLAFCTKEEEKILAEKFYKNAKKVLEDIEKNGSW